MQGATGGPGNLSRPDNSQVLACALLKWLPFLVIDPKSLKQSREQPRQAKRIERRVVSSSVEVLNPRGRRHAREVRLRHVAVVALRGFFVRHGEIGSRPVT